MSLYLKKEFDGFLKEEDKSAIIDSAKFAESFGVNAYLIGGIVRDMLLKNPLKDIDIAIEGDAVEFAEFLVKQTDCKIISIQEKLRTAKIQFLSGVEIDFASTREEKYERQGFLPEAYNFGCPLETDVKRRDFTINTLALKLTGDDKFKLIDYVDGYNDLLNKKIKILHTKSFQDDPSRIIRALKFKARFDFNIDENTYKLMQDYLNNVDNSIPLERIKNELRQFFSIRKQGLYDEIINTKAFKLISDNPLKEIDYNRISEILEFDLYDESEFWFLLNCCLIIKSSYAEERLNMTAFEKKVIEETKELLDNVPIKINDNEKIYKLFYGKIDLSVALLYIITGEKAVLKFLTVLRQIKVLINGKDLIEVGFIPSSYFSELFDIILKEKLKGKLKTKEEEIKFVKKFLKKQSS